MSASTRRWRPSSTSPAPFWPSRSSSLSTGAAWRWVSRVRAAAPPSVSLVRVGVEAAGHYHLPLRRRSPGRLEAASAQPRPRGHAAQGERPAGGEDRPCRPGGHRRPVARRPGDDRAGVRRCRHDADRLGRPSPPPLARPPADHPAADDARRPLLPWPRRGGVVGRLEQVRPAHPDGAARPRSGGRSARLGCGRSPRTAGSA